MIPLCPAVLHHRRTQTTTRTLESFWSFEAKFCWAGAGVRAVVLILLLALLGLVTAKGSEGPLGEKVRSSGATSRRRRSHQPDAAAGPLLGLYLIGVLSPPSSARNQELITTGTKAPNFPARPGLCERIGRWRASVFNTTHDAAPVPGKRGAASAKRVTAPTYPEGGPHSVVSNFRSLVLVLVLSELSSLRSTALSSVVSRALVYPLSFTSTDPAGVLVKLPFIC